MGVQNLTATGAVTTNKTIPVTLNSCPHVLSVRNDGPGPVTVDWQLGAGQGMVVSYSGPITLASGDVKNLAVQEPYHYGELVVSANGGNLSASISVVRV
jgi:hypothetical protein